MKAIFIPNDIWDPISLNKLNNELKDCDKILYKQKVNLQDNIHVGDLIIVRNYTRKDKLKKLNEINE